MLGIWICRCRFSKTANGERVIHKSNMSFKYGENPLYRLRKSDSWTKYVLCRQEKYRFRGRQSHFITNLFLLLQTDYTWCAYNNLINFNNSGWTYFWRFLAFCNYCATRSVFWNNVQNFVNLSRLSCAESPILFDEKNQLNWEQRTVAQLVQT